MKQYTEWWRRGDVRSVQLKAVEATMTINSLLGFRGRCVVPTRWIAGVVAVGAGLLALCVQPALASDAVLLSSTAPGYAPGMVIAPHDRLVLPEGTSATLLFQSGQMLRLRGPFDRALDQVPANGQDPSPGLLADLLRMQGVDAAVIGGTRALGGGWRPPEADDVVLDPQRSGTYCLGPATSIWIARPVQASDSYALRRHGNARAVSWPPGASRIEWPTDVPIEDGDRFEAVALNTVIATFTFRMMDARFRSAAAWVAAGILHGCHEQFAGALRQLRGEAGPPELWLSTDRGRQPTYHPGEAVVWQMQSDTDGYVYCVSKDAEGTVAPVFPAGAIDGARVRGGESVSLPGHRSHTVLRAGAKGTQAVRCWLADRDFAAEIPSALLESPAGTLPDQAATDLERLFTRAAASRAVSVTLPVRVE
jgi:hypothetical protein